jgi:2-C-methyl-D-erythritol 4-phosphate cytidylyltransferase
MSDKPFITAIIAAAGTSSRMKGINKLMFKFNDMEVIAHTILKFNNNVNIDEIIISTQKDSIAEINGIINKYNFLKVKAVVEGGSTRAQSIKNSLSAASYKTEYSICGKYCLFNKGL